MGRIFIIATTSVQKKRKIFGPKQLIFLNILFEINLHYKSWKLPDSFQRISEKNYTQNKQLTQFVPRGGQICPPLSSFNIAPKLKKNFCFDASWLWIKFNNTHFQKVWGQPDNRKWRHFCFCQEHLWSFIQFWAPCMFINTLILFIVLRFHYRC